MVENSRDSRTFRFSRRSALTLPAVLGLAGCGLSPQYAQDHDPYLRAMKKDPMVAWKPPMAVARKVLYSSRDEVTMEPGSSQTQIQIRLRPDNLQDLPELLAAAKAARTQAGYSEMGRRHAGRIDKQDFYFDCDVTSSPSYDLSATPSLSAQDEEVHTILFLVWGP
jgi:hypothetical protein